MDELGERRVRGWWLKTIFVLYGEPSVVRLHLSDGWLSIMEGRPKVHDRACKE